MAKKKKVKHFGPTPLAAVHAPKKKKPAKQIPVKPKPRGAPGAPPPKKHPPKKQPQKKPTRQPSAAGAHKPKKPPQKKKPTTPQRQPSAAGTRKPAAQKPQRQPSAAGTQPPQRQPSAAGSGGQNAKGPKPVFKPVGAPGMPHPNTVKQQRYEKARGAPIRVDGKHGVRTQVVLDIARKPVGAPGVPRQYSKTDYEARIRAAEASTIHGRMGQRIISDTQREKERRQVIDMAIKQDNIAQRRLGLRGRAFRESGLEAFGRQLITTKNLRTNKAVREYVNPKILVGYLYDPYHGVWKDADKHPEIVLNDRKNTKVLQEWLRQRGHKKAVVANGSWGGKNGTATIKAMKQESREIARVERTRNIQIISKVYFDTGMVTARGVRLPGSPVGAPTRHFTPETLYDFLMTNSPEAKEVARYLGNVNRWHIQDRKDAWIEALAEQNKIYANYIGATTGSRLVKDPRTKVINFKMAKFVDPDKPGGLFHDMLQQVAKLIPDALEPGLKWFGSNTVKAWDYFVHETEAGAVGLWHLGNPDKIFNEGNWDLDWKYEAAQFKRSEKAVKEFHENHFWWGMAIDIVADPSTYVGIGILRKVAVIGLKPTVLSKIGVIQAERKAMGMTGHTINVMSRTQLKALTSPTVIEKFIDKQWENVARAWNMHPVTAGAVHLARTAVVQKAILMAKAKQETTASLHRLGEVVTMGGAKYGRKFPIPKDVKAAMQNGRVAVAIDVAHAAADLVQHAVREGVQLHADIRLIAGDSSEVGHLIEGSVMTQVDQGAARDAARIFAETETEQWTAMMRAKGPLTRAQEAEHLAQVEKWAKGQFLAPWGPASPELMAIWEPLVKMRTRSWRKVIRPEIQRQIEELKGLDDLFEESGLAKQSDEASAVLEAQRGQAREIFNESTWVTMDNPNWDKHFSTVTKDRMVRAERRFWGSRIAYRERTIERSEQTRGMRRDRSKSANELWLKKAREINWHWQEVEPGVWRDTRQVIEVPPEYAKWLWDPGSFRGPLDDLVANVSRLARLDHGLSWNAIKTDDRMFLFLFEKAAIELGYHNEPWFQEMFRLMSVAAETGGFRRFTPGHFIETGSYVSMPGGEQTARIAGYDVKKSAEFLKLPEWGGKGPRGRSRRLDLGTHWRDRPVSELQADFLEKRGVDYSAMDRGAAADKIDTIMDGWTRKEKILAVGGPRPKQWVPDKHSVDPSVWQTLWKNVYRGEGKMVRPGDVQMDVFGEHWIGPHPHVAEFKEIVSKMTEVQYGVKARSDEMRHALDTAEPFMNAKIMLDNAAYAEALRWAQWKPARVLYLGLNGMMGTWRFLTLPLKPGWMVVNTIDNVVKTLLAGTVDPRIWFYPLAMSASKLFAKTAPKSAFEMGLRELFESGRFLAKLNGVEDDFVRMIGGVYDKIWHTPAETLSRIFDVHDVMVSPGNVNTLMAADMLRRKIPEVPIPAEFRGGKTTMQAEGDNILARFHQGDPEPPLALKYGVKSAQDRRQLVDWYNTAPKKKVVPGARMTKFSREEQIELRANGVDPNFVMRNQARLAAIHDKIWDLFGNRTENWSRRTIFRDEYIKSMKRGTSEEQAMVNAWRKVEDTLFDYRKVTVIEDNFRIFFPFIQYWRKNSVFWAKQFEQKPFFLTSVFTGYQDALAQQNADLPEWQRRYLSLKPIGDVISRIPGLQYIGDLVGDAWFDPMNTFSFHFMYRAFKTVNPLLSPDKAGMKFISGLIDGLNDWGLSMNPLLRKPLEMFGVLNLRTWQDVIPQTTVFTAFTRKFWHDRFPNGLNLEHMLEDAVLQAMDQDLRVSGFSAAAYNRYVQMEMADQAKRGEPISRKKAEKKIADFMLVNAVVGFFAGTYLRKMSPEDIYYSKLLEDINTGEKDFLQLTPEERTLYRLWQRRGMDAVTYDSYVEKLPLIRQYYSVSWLDGQDILDEHPDLKPFVEEKYGNRNKGGAPGWVQQMMLNNETESTIELQTLLTETNLPYQVKKAAYNALVTPELHQYWARNDTHTQIQGRMIRAQMYAQVDKVQKEYYRIPEGPNAWKDRQEFLDHHPELTAFWQHTGADSGDLKTIYHSVAGDLRKRYFEILNEPGGPDFDKAIGFLQKHPWIFDPLPKYRNKYRTIAKVGHYPGYTPYSKGSFGKSHGTSVHARDYLHARPYLNHFFALMDKSKTKAYAWLNGNSKGAKIVRQYFSKYSDPKKLSQHAKDYRKAKAALTKFFNMLARNKTAAYKWLRGNSAQARQVRKYLDKYGKDKKPSQHQKDYLKAQKWLKVYFKLFNKDRQAAYAYLRSNKPGAKILREYFAKYGKKHDVSQHSKDYENVKDQLTAYFNLPEAQRRAYLQAHPELEAYFDKYASEGGQSQHHLDYEAIKPVLDAYFSISDPAAKRKYLDAHPELRDYFAKYSTAHKVEKGFTQTIYKPKQYAQRTAGYRVFTTRRGRSFNYVIPEEVVLTENPELRKRLEFWHLYYALPPDERIQFMEDHAEEYGVFIYGANGEQQIDDNMAEWMRKAHIMGVDSERSARYAYVKPMLDFYYTLDPADREIFRRAMPELDAYLDDYSDKPSSGDPELDALIDKYFRLPAGSHERADLLKANPQLQDFLDENSTAEDSAIHTSLDAYFKLESSGQKKEYLLAHPELSAYFEKRRNEKALEKKTMEAFDRADPRLKPFFEHADFEILHAAYLRRKRSLVGTARDLVLEDRRRQGRKPLKRPALAY